MNLLNTLRSARCECKTLWYQSARRRAVRLRLDEPIVSITYDDVPISAMTTGVPILNEFAVHATFYVSLGIEGEFLGPAEVQALHQSGHEIGCHTFRHRRLSANSIAGLLADAEENRGRIARLTGGRWPRNFSFPYGELSLAAKGGLAPFYDSLRSTRPGVNKGICDLNCLRSVSLERRNHTPFYIRRWLEDVERRRGWLVLYTHGVSSSPGAYDMSPDTLQALLLECRRRGLRVLPVSRALQILSSMSSPDWVKPGDTANRHGSGVARDQPSSESLLHQLTAPLQYVRRYTGVDLCGA